MSRLYNMANAWPKIYNRDHATNPANLRPGYTVMFRSGDSFLVTKDADATSDVIFIKRIANPGTRAYQLMANTTTLSNGRITTAWGEPMRKHLLPKNVQLHIQKLERYQHANPNKTK